MNILMYLSVFLLQKLIQEQPNGFHFDLLI